MRLDLKFVIYFLLTIISNQGAIIDRYMLKKGRLQEKSHNLIIVRIYGETMIKPDKTWPLRKHLVVQMVARELISKQIFSVHQNK